MAQVDLKQELVYLRKKLFSMMAIDFVGGLLFCLALYAKLVPEDETIYPFLDEIIDSLRSNSTLTSAMLVVGGMTSIWMTTKIAPITKRLNELNNENES